MEAKILLPFLYSLRSPHCLRFARYARFKLGDCCGLSCSDETRLAVILVLPDLAPETVHEKISTFVSFGCFQKLPIEILPVEP